MRLNMRLTKETDGNVELRESGSRMFGSPRNQAGSKTRTSAPQTKLNHVQASNLHKFFHHFPPPRISRCHYFYSLGKGHQGLSQENEDVRKIEARTSEDLEEENKRSLRHLRNGDSSTFGPKICWFWKKIIREK